MVWQLGGLASNGYSAATTTGECWVGSGYSCRQPRDDDFVNAAGQRLSHGHVTGQSLLNDETGHSWCTGGTMIAHVFNTEETDVVRKQRCQDICYSDGLCSAWQYSMSAGCWLGSPASCSSESSQYTTSMTGGENITRTCSPGMLASVGDVSQHAYMWSAVAGLGLLLVCMAGVIFAFSRRRTRVKGRAVKMRDDPSTSVGYMPTPQSSLVTPMSVQTVMSPSVLPAGPTTAFTHQTMPISSQQQLYMQRPAYATYSNHYSSPSPRPPE